MRFEPGVTEHSRKQQEKTVSAVWATASAAAAAGERVRAQKSERNSEI
jgi:hypothetical protein